MFSGITFQIYGLLCNTFDSKINSFVIVGIQRLKISGVVWSYSIQEKLFIIGGVSLLTNLHISLTCSKKFSFLRYHRKNCLSYCTLHEVAVSEYYLRNYSGFFNKTSRSADKS